MNTIVDIHAHVLFPEVMGLCGAAGPEMGDDNGVPFFRSAEYVLTNVKFANSPFSDLKLRLAAMDSPRRWRAMLKPRARKTTQWPPSCARIRRGSRALPNCRCNRWTAPSASWNAQ